MNHFLKIVSGIGAAGCYLLAQQKLLKTTRIKVRDEKIPENFNGFKIAHISDFHNEKGFLAKSIIRVLNKEKPDIIVVTGDMAGYDGYDNAEKFAKEITEIAPVLYVAGNHEAKNGHYDLFSKYLLSCGFSVLDNLSTKIRIKDQEINIFGIKDPSFVEGATRIEHESIAEKELSSFSFDDNYTILLTHHPEWIDIYSKYSVNLIFAGHAHGGQWRIPIVGGVFSPGQGFLPKYTSGVIKKGKAQMIVSRGIGNQVRIPRINNRPELVIATLFN